MAHYTVHFTKIESISVRVEADSPEDAIEMAYDEAPADVCAQCSGWGQRWTRESPDELTAETVWNDDDNSQAWEAPDQWTRGTS